MNNQHILIINLFTPAHVTYSQVGTLIGPFRLTAHILGQSKDLDSLQQTKLPQLIANDSKGDRHLGTIYVETDYETDEEAFAFNWFHHYTGLLIRDFEGFYQASAKTFIKSISDALAYLARDGTNPRQIKTLDLKTELDWLTFLTLLH